MTKKRRTYRQRKRATGTLSPAIRAILARTAAERARLDAIGIGADMRGLDALPIMIFGTAVTKRPRRKAWA